MSKSKNKEKQSKDIEQTMINSWFEIKICVFLCEIGFLGQRESQTTYCSRSFEAYWEWIKTPSTTVKVVFLLRVARVIQLHYSLSKVINRPSHGLKEYKIIITCAHHYLSSWKRVAWYLLDESLFWISPFRRLYNFLGNHYNCFQWKGTPHYKSTVQVCWVLGMSNIRHRTVNKH